MLDFRNTNSLWGSVLVETLHRLGVRQAVISPGSRSTPLTIAFVQHTGIECIPVLDERSAGFFALGLARRHRQPVVLLCTSGTAGANYFPAVIEAQESGVPLLVITADRPPEMRECGSGQTIDQQKLYGSHVSFYHELAVPVASLALLRYLRQTVVQAWSRAQWPVAGPVHLNAPFRDPLPPIEDGTVTALRKTLKIDPFFAAVQPPPIAASLLDSMDFPSTQRGLIVVGPAEGRPSSVEIGLLSALARDLGWPVLADGLSGLRDEAAQFPQLVTRYDSIVRSAATGKRLKPEVVLCIGGWPTSKPLRGWLEESAPEVWLVTKRAQNLDALHLATRHVHGGLAAFVGSAVISGKGPVDYAESWQRAERAAVQSLDRSLAKAAKKFEGRVVGVLARQLPKFTPVFVANSMPVRDVEYFWPATDRAAQFYFNRGSNGIDGTLSTALGMAHGNRPAVLLTGDLALLHDSNGFLIRPKFKGSLTIVLINNQGGGIFEHLPIAQFNPPFEEFFATPQQADFKKLCAAHGVTHVRVRDLKHLANLVAKLPRYGIRVLELGTDRKQDAAYRKEIFAAAASAAESALK
ncbi:MAG: 2-succinyl-5-enolpyruvyl-6-hydroxy-3-cyclohexene-1-carboxylic-acid synthase [Opitutaceae bacterium]